MKEEVNIDWSTATDNQLSELYDALYERNGKLAAAVETLHFRVNIGDCYEKAEAFKNGILTISKDLVDSILNEVTRRRVQKSKSTFSEFSCARPGGPDEVSELQS